MPGIQYYYIYLGSGCGRAKTMFLSQFVLVTLLVDMQAGLQARRIEPIASPVAATCHTHHIILMCVAICAAKPAIFVLFDSSSSPRTHSTNCENSSCGAPPPEPVRVA